jgi:hypothetical protein
VRIKVSKRDADERRHQHLPVQRGQKAVTSHEMPTDNKSECLRAALSAVTT